MQSVCGFGIIHTEEPRKAQDNKQGQEKDNKMDKDNNKIVAVKCEGCFTEWYSPFFKEPYEDNAEYREFYNEHVLNFKPVIGPSLGDSEDDYISGDLQFHAERMCCDAKDWSAATNGYADAIEKCLADGKPRTWKDVDGVVDDVKITPVTKAELPPLTDDALKVFGDFGWLIRERYNAI